jgi:hypothetical protein
LSAVGSGCAGSDQPPRHVPFLRTLRARLVHQAISPAAPTYCPEEEEEAKEVLAPAMDVNAMIQKRRLRQIDTDERCKQRTISLMKTSCPSMALPWPKRDVHLIKAPCKPIFVYNFGLESTRI